MRAAIRSKLLLATLFASVVCSITAPAGAAAPASISLPGERVFPENMTATRDGTLYVGSLGEGGVFRIAAHSRQAKIWIKPGAFGTRAVFGVLADEKSHMLWVCSNDMSKLGITIPGSDTVSMLKGFDLKTGVGKVSAALPGQVALCNDIAVGADGSVFVTNTMAPQILRLAPGATALEVWFTDPALQPAQGAGFDGLAFGEDGTLYFDTYTPGELFRIDVHDGKAGKATKLHPSRKLVLADGIRPLGKNRFLIVEGGGRLDSMTIQGDAARIDTLKDGLDVPTGTAAVGDTAWVSEGQLSYVFDPTRKGQSPRLPFKIFSAAIPTR
jgi:sugar lactone lactonase YvrE